MNRFVALLRVLQLLLVLSRGDSSDAVLLKDSTTGRANEVRSDGNESATTTSTTSRSDWTSFAVTDDSNGTDDNSSHVNSAPFSSATDIPSFATGNSFSWSQQINESAANVSGIRNAHEDTILRANVSEFPHPNLEHLRLFGSSNLTSFEGFHLCEYIHGHCTSDANNDSESLSARKYCSCRPDCRVYGDCCVNATSDAKVESHDTSSAVSPMFSCRYVYIEGHGGVPISMVSFCPRDTHRPEDDAHRLCQEEVQNDDYFPLIPVTSRRTNLTYRNVFCAICHEDFEVTAWNVSMTCTTKLVTHVKMADVATNETELSLSTSPFNVTLDADGSDGHSGDGDDPTVSCSDSEVVLTQVFNEATRLQELLPKLSIADNIKGLLHECSPFAYRYRQVSSCSVSLDPETPRSDAELAEPKELMRKCHTYFTPMSLSFDSSVTYKNRYCALCDGVRAEDLECNLEHVSRPFSDEVGFSDVRVLSGPAVIGKTTPISVLVDMNFLSGETVVGKTRRCPKKQVYNPFKKACLNVYCGRKFVLKGDACIPATDRRSEFSNDTNESTSGGLHSDQLVRVAPIDECPQVFRFGPNEYRVEIDENGTATVFGPGDVTLTKDQFVFEDNNTVLVVCATDDSPYIDQFGKVHGHLSVVGCTVTIVSLIVKIILDCSVLRQQNKNNLPSKIVLQLSASLLVAQLLFVTSSYRTEPKEVCAAVGVSMHYFFLVAFFWMNTLAYDIWKTFSGTKSREQRVSHNGRLAMYCVYAWGVPLVIVAVGIVFEWAAPWTQFRPLYGLVVCWISNRIALFAFFGCPLAALLLFNAFFFVATVVKISMTSRVAKMAQDNAGNRKERVRLVLYIKLALIMGLTWIFAFLASFLGNAVLWYVFVVFNSCQGLFVLVAFTHLRQVCRSSRKKKIGACGVQRTPRVSTEYTTSTVGSHSTRRTESTSLSTSSVITEYDESQRTHL